MQRIISDKNCELRQSEKLENYKKAINFLNKAYSINDSFFPALIEKSKLHLKLHEYDNALETSCALMDNFDSNIDVLRSCSCIQLIYLGSCNETFLETCDKIIDYLSVNISSECNSNSSMLCHQMASLYGRLSGQKEEVLGRALSIISKSCRGRNCSRCELELAYLLRQSNYIDKALESYYQSLKYDESNLEAALEEGFER